MRINDQGVLVAAGSSIIPPGGTPGQILLHDAAGPKWGDPVKSEIVYSSIDSAGAPVPTIDAGPYLRMKHIITVHGSNLSGRSSGNLAIEGTWADDHDLNYHSAAANPNTWVDLILMNGSWNKITAVADLMNDGGWQIGQFAMARGDTSFEGMLVAKGSIFGFGYASVPHSYLIIGYRK